MAQSFVLIRHQNILICLLVLLNQASFNNCIFNVALNIFLYKWALYFVIYLLNLIGILLNCPHWEIHFKIRSKSFLILLILLLWDLLCLTFIILISYFIIFQHLEITKTWFLRLNWSIVNRKWALKGRFLRLLLCIVYLINFLFIQISRTFYIFFILNTLHKCFIRLHLLNKMHHSLF